MMQHTSTLTSLIDDWAAHGWPLSDLTRFRMEDGDDDKTDDTGDQGDDDKTGGGDSGDDKSADDTKDKEPDAKAEAEKWKAMARKHEQQAKANAAAAKELAVLKASQMSDTEKAVSEAEARGRQAATAAGAEKLAAAEIKAALTGVVPDPAAIVEDLNLGKYITEDGDVDADKVAALKEKYTGLAPAKGKHGPDLKQGNRGGSKESQLSRDDLKNMTPEQIVKAKAAGRLNDILGVSAT